MNSELVTTSSAMTQAQPSVASMMQAPLSFRDQAVLVLVGGVREKHEEWTVQMIEGVFNLADAMEAERTKRGAK